MFDQIKKIRELQKKLKEESVFAEYEGTEITMNGHMEIEEIKLNKERGYEQLEEDIKKCFKKASDELKKKLKGSLM